MDKGTAVIGDWGCYRPATPRITTMPKSKLTRTLAQFAGAFAPAALNDLGRDTGFLRRKRDITPANLIPALVAALGSGRVTTLAELWSWFCELTGVEVEYKSFHERLDSAGFPVLMDKFVEYLSGHLMLQALRFLPTSPFARFKRIYAQDGSSLAVHNALAKIFPGRFKKVSPAAVELHPTFDLLSEAPVITYLTADTHSERDCLPEPASLAGSLLLADRGYPSFEYLAKVDKADGSYIMRAKSDLVSDVLGFYAAGILVGLPEAVPLPDYVAAHQGAVLDLQIRPKTGDYGTFRMVILLTPKGLTRLLTNLPASEFPPQFVGICYRLRWQIELMFKEWKSYANLHKFGTKSEHITEGLLWASIASALLKRFLAKAAQMVGEVAVSTLKAARQLVATLPNLIAALFSAADDLLDAFAHTLQGLMQRAKRSNPRRERRIGRQKLGLRPVYAL